MSTPPLRVVDTLHLAFTIPSTQDGEWGVLVPHGRVWWLICPVAATLYARADDDFEDCSDPTCEWIEDVHRRAGQVARLMGQSTSARGDSASSPLADGAPFLGAGVCELHEVCRRGEQQCPYHQALASSTPKVSTAPATEPLASGEEQS